MNQQPDLDARRRSLIPYLKYFGLHILLLLTGCIIYAILTRHILSPDAYTFLNWDAVHYDAIRSHGYFYSPYTESNVAFFPGFPYLWKFLHIGIAGIMLFNFSVFSITILLICHHLDIAPVKMMLYCSLPSIFFLYMPYSEALFFCTSALVLAGIDSGSRYLGSTGFFLCSITRSAANVFVPSIIITELLSPGNSRKWWNISVYVSSCLAGIAVVSFIEHQQTGEWLGFIKTQRFWGHTLRWPKFPLGTTEGMLFFDAAALATGVGAMVSILYIAWKRLIKKTDYINKAWLFSACYLAGVTTISLAYKGQSIYSLNRYIFPTVFCLIFLNKSGWHPSNIKKFTGIFFLSVTVLWAVFNAFSHIQILLKFLILSVYFCLFAAAYYSREDIRKIAFTLSYTLNLSLQIYLLFRFMDCGWVG